MGDAERPRSSVSFRVRRRALAAVALAAVVATTAALWAAAPAQTPPQTPPAQTPARPTAAPASPDQVPVFESTVDVVALDVAVVDEDGRPVRGLTPGDFVLEVDGKPRAVDSVQFIEQHAASGPPPSEFYSTNEGAMGGRLVLLVADIGNITPGRGRQFLRAANTLLDNLGPGDRVGLTVIPGAPSVDFTDHFGLVRERLATVVGASEQRPQFVNMAISEAIEIQEGNQFVLEDVVARECAGYQDQAREVCVNDIQVEAQGMSNTIANSARMSLNSLRQILSFLGTVPGPKTIVFISEGLILPPDVRDVDWISKAANDAKVTMYAVQLAEPAVDVSAGRPSPRQSEDLQRREEGLSLVVGYARGDVFRVAVSADYAFERMAREMAGYYLLSFTPEPSEKDGRTRRIKLQVKRPGVSVRTRRDFSVSPTPAAPRTTEAVLAEALRDPRLWTEIQMRMTTYNFPDPQKAGAVRVLVAANMRRVQAEVPIKSVAFRILDADGKLLASRISDINKDEQAEIRDDQPYLTTHTLPPGSYTLKIAAVDLEGRRGTVEHRFRAATRAGGTFTLGDLMLSDAGVVRGGSLVPNIAPAVASGAVNGYVEFQSEREHGMLGRATVALEIAREPNAPAIISGPLKVESTKFEHRRVAQGQIPLGTLPPGEYVARAVVSVEGRPVARLLRGFTYSPSSATLAGLGPRYPIPPFERARVATGPALAHFMGRLEKALPEEVVTGGPFVAARSADWAKVSSLGPRDDPQGTGAFLRGLALFGAGEIEKAAVEFRAALRTAPDQVPAAFYLGACYAAGGRDREAVGAWQTVLAADGVSPIVFEHAIDAYLRLGDWEEADALAREALELWPELPRVHLRRALALANAGKPAEALEAMEAHFAEAQPEPGTLFAALRLIYEARMKGEPVTNEVARFEKLYEAYRAVDGAEQVLVGEWLSYLRK